MTPGKRFRWLTGLMIILMLAEANNMYSQVTIGSDSQPQGFSVLELISNGARGLRLPQMTEAQRDAMVGTPEFQAAKTTAACGLCIFNISSECINTWNGVKWIERCYIEIPKCVDFPTSLAFSALTKCSGSKISDLPASSGANSLLWYNVATGGAALANTANLTDNTKYYAAAVNSEGCESTIRAEVTVSFFKTSLPYNTLVKCTGSYVSDLPVSEGGNTLKWYSANSGGSPLSGSVGLVDGRKYYAAATNSEGCESATRAEVTVTLTQEKPTSLNFSVLTRCTGSKISDLPDSDGTNSLRWYSSATGGSPLDANVALSSGTTYYAASVSVAGCESQKRAEITVTLGNCNAAPSGGSLTTFINVMYDFQHQSIEAYTTGGGVVIDYTWQVSTNGSNFVDIAGAPNSPFFTIPANFSDRHVSGSYKSAELWFRCKMTNTQGSVTTPDNLLKIIFIKTTSAGYGTGPDGIKYLTLNAGNNGKKIKMALYNLGASENNDAGDFGDFHQWGRVADGHQHVRWIKNASHINKPVTSGEIGANMNSYPTYNSSRQVNPGNFYGIFIMTSSFIQDWYCPNIGNVSSDHNGTIWGNSNGSRQAYNFTWTYPQNNPCPSGWTVPNAYLWWDIFSGTGSDALPATTVNTDRAYATASRNGWEWIAPNSTGVVGGIIITNFDGEKLFLPAAGTRTSGSATFMESGTIGCYWSSSAVNPGSTTEKVSYCLRFDGNGASSGYNNAPRGIGCSVRPIVVEP